MVMMFLVNVYHFKPTCQKLVFRLDEATILLNNMKKVVARGLSIYIYIYIYAHAYTYIYDYVCNVCHYFSIHVCIHMHIMFFLARVVLHLMSDRLL